MERDLLRPLQDQFGMVALTFGFASADLIKVIKKRAAEGGWLPGISPQNDQHAGHELNARSNRICKHDGIAVDLRVPGISSEIVARWAIDHLPFDAVYLYAPERPFHLSWAPDPRGMVVRMMPRSDKGRYPRIETRGRVKGTAR
jgi:hypothetical protein